MMKIFPDRESRRAAIEQQDRLFPTQRYYRDVTTFRRGTIREEFAIRPTLPEMCLGLRSSVRGDGDAWSSAFLGDVVSMLRERVRTWDTSDDPIDSCVLSMTRLAIDLGASELAKREREGSRL
jgi:hypothetical protein